MAAAASWLESLKIPLREMRKRFTKSELAVMAWRSSEISYNMTRNMHDTRTRQEELTRGVESFVNASETEKKLAILEEKIGGFIWKAVDEKTGELDLRKLTGDEMQTYMQAIGYEIPNMVPRR